METNLHFSIKKISVAVAVLTVIILVFCLLVYFQGKKVYGFAGNVENIENGVVSANGHFLKDGVPISGQENNIASIQIKTDSNTKITRLAISIPSGATSFDTRKLKQQESTASLDAIQNDFRQTHSIGIQGSLHKGFFDKDYTADTLYFRVPVFGN